MFTSNQMLKISLKAALLLSYGCQSIDAPPPKVAQATASALARPTSTSPKCAAMLAARKETDLALNLQQFDQDFKGGWRTLDNESCFFEAAHLIELYIEKNGVNHSQLYFHTGQLLASAGDNAEAVIKLKAALLPLTADSGAFLWNDYVLGTIAFLEKDKAALVLRLDKLKQKPSMNGPNITVLQKLLDKFEASYDEATK